jgi:cytochrome oxidase Cu insertion factor (SCO1/SenC/PrrC family)
MSISDSSGAPAGRSNRTLWLILAVCLVPLLASYALYAFWRPSRFVNYGELINPPVLLGDVTLPRREGKPFHFADLKGQWILLMVDSGDCDEPCLRKLYYMRQLRRAQGKDQERVERVWLITDQRQPAARVEQEYAGTIQVKLGDTQFLTTLPAPVSPAQHIYLIDPLGNLMMRFPRDPDPNKMKKDIAKVLRLSSGWVQVR